MKLKNTKSQMGSPTQEPSYETETLLRAEEKQKQKRSNTLRNIILLVLLIIMLVSAVGFIITFSEKKKHEEDMHKYIDMVEPQQEEEEKPTYPSEPSEYLPQYRALYAVNSDLVGWIRVPNTTINHPVVQGKDNSYYLHRDFETKEYKKHGRGTVFADYRNHVKTLDKNTILYGHNYLDSTMFSQLENFKDIEFYKTTPTIYFDTVYEQHAFKVFAVFYSTADPELDNGYVFNYIYPAMTDENFMDYIKEVEKRSLWHTAVDIEPTDKILTLSTCTRDLDLVPGQQKNVRLVVLARLVRPGESENVDVSLASIHENPKQPQLWYDKHKQENPFKTDPKWYPVGTLKGAKA